MAETTQNMTNNRPASTGGHEVPVQLQGGGSNTSPAAPLNQTHLARAQTGLPQDIRANAATRHVWERMRDDLNAAICRRNEERLRKRLAGAGEVSEDEDTLSDHNLRSMFRTNAVEENSSPDAVVDISTPTNAVTSSWAFSDQDAVKNVQQPYLDSIPGQLLFMFKNRVYIPLTFFLTENMDRIRLEQNIKTRKSISKPCRIIEESNFQNERELDYAQFSEAYHNFLRCMELSMPPNSWLPLAWDDHFTRATQDPRMRRNFRAYLYMDIKMRQQLVDLPFAPDPCSREYGEAFQIAWQEVFTADIDKKFAEVRSQLAAQSSYQSNKERRFQPYTQRDSYKRSNNQNNSGREGNHQDRRGRRFRKKGTPYHGHKISRY